MTEVASVTDAGPSLILFWLLVFSHLPPFYFPFLFKWSGYQTSSRTTCLKRKRCQGTVKCQLYSYIIFLMLFVQFFLFGFCFVCTSASIYRLILVELGTLWKYILLSVVLHSCSVFHSTTRPRPPLDVDGPKRVLAALT